MVARLRHDQQTRNYLARRISEGKSKKEAIRYLKHYVAREIFAALKRTPKPSQRSSSHHDQDDAQLAAERDRMFLEAQRARAPAHRARVRPLQ